MTRVRTEVLNNFIQTRGHYIQSLKLHEILGEQDLEDFRMTMAIHYILNDNNYLVEILHGGTMDLK